MKKILVFWFLISGCSALHDASNTTFNFIRFNLDYTSSSDSFSCKGFVFSQGDSLIFGLVGPLGINISKILFTQDSVFGVDLLHKIYFEGSFNNGEEIVKNFFYGKISKFELIDFFKMIARIFPDFVLNIPSNRDNLNWNVNSRITKHGGWIHYNLEYLDLKYKVSIKEKFVNEFEAMRFDKSKYLDFKRIYF